ncbi:MAG TPA: alanine racemase [Bryobacteraceae bacterium]|nr:alanine racemase [Bryobacteraceae bacterium]
MAPYRSWVEISRKQIVDNFRTIQQAVGAGVEVMPVVKADAYRHGAVEVSKALVDAGARWLAVGCVDEGVALREAGIGVRILVMADFLPFEREELIARGLTPVIHSLADLRELNALAEKRGQPLAYHLKIDTGMSRLGTRATPAEIAQAILSNRCARLEGLMTHFASAADYTTTQTEDQIERFRRVCDSLQAASIRADYLHLSSTIPIAYGRRVAWGSMVRPGHAIYGYVSPARGPAPPKTLCVKPALTWKATVLAVKDIEEGSLVGYGGMFRAPRPMRIAVLAAGYADGIPHRLSNRGRVIARGKFAPIVGAVSMDLTTIDITHAPDLEPGDAVTLLGREGDASIDAQQIARTAGTISYSVLCGISSRVRRIYV